MSIDNKHEIIILAYADDLILLSDTPYGMNELLRLLKDYCEANRLILNTKKTKVMIFHRGSIRKLREKLAFNYGDERLEIVSQYKYLGVIFSDTGLFFEATDPPGKRGGQVLTSNLITVQSFIRKILQI